ncbi:MAG TPA: MG2 domain-containing protein, partial [Geminicoccaceae bacterium]
WGASIRSPAGRLAGTDRRFDFTVRREFTARLTCSRVNPQSGCNPVEAIKVQFTAPVPRAQALAARLDVGDGRRLAPADSGNDASLSEIRFKPAVPPAITARLLLPPDLRDQSGRPLANARRFPLDVAIAQPPPLVKFAAPFGILEAKQGGVLPVTVRGVEATLGQSVKAIGGAAARIDGDDGAVADWVRRVAKAQQDDIREEGPKKKLVNHTGDRPILAGKAAGAVQRMQLALPGRGRQFEVVGLPLSKPGFYVVELASPILGQALLGRPATRYVNAAALVTDLSVHFKWGRGASLAWVTSLDDGKPVAGAAVRVTDSCSGRLLASGTTDRSGRLLFDAGRLPQPSTASGCENNGGESPPLMVSARLGGDFSFVLTTWSQGIQPFDFDLPYGWNETRPVFHTVLDRTLLRAGETVHMKHIYRTPTAAGFRSGGALDAQLVLQHRGSDTSFELPLRLGADGLGENEWTAPKDAPSGDYDLRVKRGDDVEYTNQSFRLDEYRLPSMRASVTGPKDRRARPKRLPVDLYVGYLAGGGAASAPVKLRTAYEFLDDSPEGWDGWSFGGAPVREGVVALDEERNDEGRGTLPEAATLPLTLDAEGALRSTLDLPELPDSVRLRLEMDYEDANGETLTASSSIPIHGSAVRLGIKPDGWLQREGDMRLKVAALGLDGKVIRGQRVRIALYTREILSVRRRLIGGFYAFDNNAKVTRLGADCSAVTDEHGLAECT